MGENTKIEWAHHTFNPWVGCTKVSPACDNCYAEGWAKRTGQAALWRGERRRTAEASWRAPLRWDRHAAERSTRERVFCASLADVFDNQVPEDWRTDLWALISATPNLDWLLLTKRPQNIARMLPANWRDDYPNVWLGTTVENQAEANRRIPHLLAVPARLRFLSCEPLLWAVDLMRVEAPRGYSTGLINAFTGVMHDHNGVPLSWHSRGTGIGWVIAGGESGPGARPSHPDWFRALRDQCAAAGVPWFFKQWGEHGPVAGGGVDASETMMHPDGRVETVMRRVGKRLAGATLDGREHREFPR